jgi:hypothetical protein
MVKYNIKCYVQLANVSPQVLWEGKMAGVSVGCLVLLEEEKI